MSAKTRSSSTTRTATIRVWRSRSSGSRWSDHRATPFGVFRSVERSDYGMGVSRQLAEASTKRGPGDLATLLRCNGTWAVTN